MLISTIDIIHLMLAGGDRCEKINKTRHPHPLQPERDWVRVNGRNISKETNKQQYNSLQDIRHEYILFHHKKVVGCSYKKL